MSERRRESTIWVKENLSLPRALNPPWKPSALLHSVDEWSGILGRVHKHLSSPCPELSRALHYTNNTSLPTWRHCSALPHRALMGTFSRHSQHSGQQWVQVGDGQQDLSSTSSSVKISFSTSTFYREDSQSVSQLNNVLLMEGGRPVAQPATTTYSR